jgi:hypothetical protein
MQRNQSKVYKTMQGRELDMDKLIARNEMEIAVGNMSVNARGDQIGAGGKIIKTREELIAERNQANDPTGGV